MFLLNEFETNKSDLHSVCMYGGKKLPANFGKETKISYLPTKACADWLSKQVCKLHTFMNLILLCLHS